MGSPIAFLAGVWRGSGAGEFPTMEAFTYHEEVRFIDHGAPSLVYQQRAWSTEDDELLHVESGIWRSSPDGTLAVSVALPRVTELSEGRIKGGAIRLTTTAVQRAAGGAGLVAVERSYDIDGDEIRYRIAMATERVTQITHHLEGTLRRAAADER